MSEIDPVVRAVEAALFAAHDPQTLDDLAAQIGADADIAGALETLQADYAGRGVELVERGGRWHFQTASDLAWLLRRETEQTRKLSRAATETLAIIAYHEPVSRAEIEAIRGVQVSKGTIDVLMEEGWIAPAGRREAPGRPLIYATTPGFLTHFGLTSRRDLPGLEDLRAAGLLDPVDLALEGALATDDKDGDPDDGADGSSDESDSLLENKGDRA
ncbi:SMC-Scp complex subunit ScpB [Blastomonas sp.]|uniref:SMC-Scp complex subunit ScpB n=1 Tax=Blastomonas sp. TaxID=1909299 RepID=UPI00391A1E66